MADKLMYIPDNDTQNYFFCKLQLVVETFEHSTWWTNQLKLNKSCYDNEKKTLLSLTTDTIKLWHDMTWKLNLMNQTIKIKLKSPKLLSQRKKTILENFGD